MRACGCVCARGVFTAVCSGVRGHADVMPREGYNLHCHAAQVQMPVEYAEGCRFGRMHLYQGFLPEQGCPGRRRCVRALEDEMLVCVRPCTRSLTNISRQFLVTYKDVRTSGLHSLLFSLDRPCPGVMDSMASSRPFDAQLGSLCWTLSAQLSLRSARVEEPCHDD